MTVVATKRFSMLLLILVALPLFAADKRHAASPQIPLVFVRGKVVDATTGNPVASAQVTNGPRSSVADNQGNFQIQVPAGVSSVIAATRSGYDSVSTAVNGAEGLTVNLTLHGKPTVSVRLTNGTVLQLDTETAQFAQEALFTSPARSDTVTLCKSDGTKTVVNRSEVSKIFGPAVSVNNAACCTASPVLKVSVELKTGERQDAVLQESCTGVFIDFTGRDHTTGQFVYTRFEDIAEIDFP